MTYPQPGAAGLSGASKVKASKPDCFEAEIFISPMLQLSECYKCSAGQALL